MESEYLQLRTNGTQLKLCKKDELKKFCLKSDVDGFVYCWKYKS